MTRRPAWAEVDLGAVAPQRRRSWPRWPRRPRCARWSRPTATATARCRSPGPRSRAGPTWLAVALVEEGAELRDAGIDAPVLLLSEPPAGAMDDVVALGLTPTSTPQRGRRGRGQGGGRRPGRRRSPSTSRSTPACTGSAPRPPTRRRWPVRPWPTGPSCASRASGPTSPSPTSPSNPFTAEQCDRVRRRAWPSWPAPGVRPPLVHAANSAGALAHPAARHDLVRCGIALYGVAPSPALRRAACRPAPGAVAAGPGVLRAGGARPARRCPTGCAGPLPSDATVVATVPDRLRRRRAPAAVGASGGEVLIGGRRRPIAGTVTMDQIMVDCGDDRPVPAGRRGRAPRPPGRRADHRREWADAARHHRLRDPVRHRPPRAPRSTSEP